MAHATAQMLNLDQIRRELACRRSPIAFSWYDGTVLDNGAPARVGHMAVIIGYTAEELRVIDPVPLCQDDDGFSGDDVESVSYTFYENGGSTTARHWEDRYAFTLEEP